MRSTSSWPPAPRPPGAVPVDARGALSDDDPIGPAMQAEGIFGATSLGPAVPATIRKLAALDPSTLALMHGPSFNGDGRAALLGLADGYEAMLNEGAA